MRTAREIGTSLARHIRNMVLSACVLFFGLGLHAQCPDFMDLTAPGVTCQYGSTSNPFQWTGIAAGRHTLITGQGADPHTNYQLPFLPPGESQVIRLGNDNVGGEAEAITYQFTVNPDYSILLVKFAVVLEDPVHDPFHQPRFVMRVVDNEGYLVNSCSEYDVFASGEIPGFNNNEMIRWRPWTNVGFDLTEYAGQQIRVQFITYDCGYFGHFGYAYFTASCISNNLEISDCDGQTVTFSVPQNFSSYNWDTGGTHYSSTYPHVPLTATCHVTSATGCEFTLMAMLMSSGLPLQDAVFYDTICEDQPYQNHLFDLSPPYQEGMNIYKQVFYNVSDCSGEGVTYTLYLTVRPKYYHIYDIACQGSDYNNHGFHYTNLPVGLILDTLVLSQPPCDSIFRILHLTVNPAFMPSTVISGDLSVCDGVVHTYSVAHNQVFNYQWQFPPGVYSINGTGNNQAMIYFTTEAPNPAILQLTGSNGCGSNTVSISVVHSPSYYIFVKDTVCSGNMYVGNGFQTPVLDGVGYHTFTRYLVTQEGCDSLIVLQLFVPETPSLEILAQPAEVCPDQLSSIHAVGGQGSLLSYYQPPIVPGDILCTDSSIVKPSNWPVPGKTAKAIIYYVDGTGQHGWAINLQNPPIMQWKTVQTLPSNHGLEDCNSRFSAMFTLDGKMNTQKLRAAGDATVFPAAWSMDFENGWYLPAIGQLMVLFPQLTVVNESLTLVNGLPLSMRLWSSTICYGSFLSANEDPWTFEVNTNHVSPFNGVLNNLARSIIDF